MNSFSFNMLPLKGACHEITYSCIDVPKCYYAVSWIFALCSVLDLCIWISLLSNMLDLCVYNAFESLSLQSHDGGKLSILYQNP